MTLIGSTRSNRRRGRPALAVLVALGVASLAAPGAACACDLCAIYTATEMRESRTGFHVGVAEQYADFGTLKRDGETVSNPANEELFSSITQLLFGYNFTPRIGLQLNLPIIARTFRRLESGAIRHGNETGFGDLSLLALARPYSRISDESVLRVSMVGGLKLPSGSPDRLQEESEEDEGADAMPTDHVTSALRDAHTGHDHEGEASGIHGHDLALGSGSVDGVIGAYVYGSWRRFFLTTSVQYLMRTQGSFDYRYANDVTWSGGPGFYVLLGHGLLGRDYSVAAQVLTTGEHKGEDELAGSDQSDTAITAVYLGPLLSLTWGTALAAELAADLPVSQRNSGLQAVPDYRLRGGLTWRF